MWIARQIAVMLGVAILLPLLTYAGANSLGAPPDWANYNTALPFNPHSTPEERAANAEKQKAERKAFADAQASFASRQLWTAAPIGCAAILLGGFLATSAIATGLIFGGLFTVVFGQWFQWMIAPQWERFVALLVCGAIIVIVGLRKAAGPTSPAYPAALIRSTPPM